MTHSLATPRDFAAYGDALEALRVKLRRLGPDSGLHRDEAHKADQLLAEIRDLVREIADRRQARLEQESQQAGSDI